jgi:hypothetical protein
MIKVWHAGLAALALLALLGLAATSAPPAVVTAAPEASVRALPLRLPAAPLPAAAPSAARPGLARAAPVPDELDRLVALARRGDDARASHAAYQALAACVAPQAEAPVFCRGLPASLLQERLRFLGQAARAGLPAAQIDFYMEGPDALQALDADALQAWRLEALAGLQGAAARCEPFAMGLLATLYDAGELMPRDATRALAYAVAEGQLRRRTVSDDSLRDRLAEPVDDAVIASAREQGQRLAAACR